MTATVAYKKKNRVYTQDMWIVSKHTTPSMIMQHDDKTMSRIDKDIYGNTKAKRHIVIRSINSMKSLGFTNK